MKNAWDQFSLITVGAVVLVYGLGVYLGLPLDQILIRCLVVGVGLAIVFTVIHIWLSSVFGEKRAMPNERKRRLATAGGSIIDRTVGDGEGSVRRPAAADGGSEASSEAGKVNPKL